MSRIEHYARAYAAKNWATFPLAPRSKEPLAGSRGMKDATTDPQSWPAGANLAVATGEISGLAVVDVDTEQGQRSLYAWFASYERFPDTLICLTPRGQHIYFRYPAEHIGCKVNVAPGVDIRATGGYVVAPPSVRDCGIYQWHPRAAPGMLPLAEMPGWLIELLRPAPRRVVPAPSGLRRCGINGRAIVEGERNRTLFKICCYLINEGRDDIEEKMLAINDARCQPPLPEAEVKRVVRHAVRRYSG
jgi:hypothetical protein